MVQVPSTPVQKEAGNPDGPSDTRVRLGVVLDLEPDLFGECSKTIFTRHVQGPPKSLCRP